MVHRGLAFITLATLLVCNMAGLARARGLVALPSQVTIAGVDPTCNEAREFPGGLNVTLPTAGAGSNANLSVQMLEALQDKASGTALPASRLLAGVTDLMPLPAKGPLSVTADKRGSIVLRLGIRPNEFDRPGIYETTLAIGETDVPGEAVRVPVRVEIRSWVAVKVTSHDSLSLTSGIPGVDSFVTSSEESVVWVSANCDWQLTARLASAPLMAVGLGKEITIDDIRVRVRPTDQIRPAGREYSRLGNQPLVLAYGGSTGSFGDGWVPVTVEYRLPFSKDYQAGKYNGLLEFGATRVAQ